MITTTKLLAAAFIYTFAVTTIPVWAQDDDYEYESDLPPGVLGETGFAVEDFVPNRVKVEATADEKRFGTTEPLTISVSAEEMFGQPIANKPVSGSVTWSPVSFSPVQWKGFTFGDSERKFDEMSLPLADEALGNDGKTSITLDIPHGRPPAALSAKVQVTVTEGGRGVTRSLKRYVDPVPYYLGIKNQGDTYPRPGEPASFEVVAVQPDGDLAPVDKVLTGTISLIQWNNNLVREGDSYVFRTHRQLFDRGSTSVTLSSGRGSLTWRPTAVGNYLIRLGDGKSTAAVSDSFYVSNDAWGRQPWSMEKPEKADLVLDKEEYVAGETARLLIKAPFPGTVLLTLEQDRVLSSTVITMTENTMEVPITITEEMLPNVYAVASVIRPVKAESQWLPHRAVGMVNLPVSAVSRVLDISLNVPDEVRPGAELTVTADVRDAATSSPVSGDIIVWAVDEGVLSLTDFETPSAGDFFFAARRLMVDTVDFFSKLMPEYLPEATAASGTGGGDMGADRLSPVSTERVKPVVLWQGPAKTDANGKLQITWQVPQYMGRLRVMAMAASGQQFGSQGADVFVRNPVMVKEHLPRFAAPGDKFTAGFTVYNNTDVAMTPTLDVSTSGLITLSDKSALNVDEVAPRGQQTILTDVSVDADQIGQGTIQFAASAGSENYGSSVTLPVRPAAPRISLGGSATVKAGETQNLKIPGGDFLPESTTVTIVAGGRPEIALFGALDYNIEYPYGCTEQVVSKLFPLLYLQDLARASNPKQYSEEGIRSIVQSGIDRVLMAQTASGGLSMWIGNREPWDWASIYAAHFLAEAKRAGYQVNPDYFQSLISYMQREHAGTSYAGHNEMTIRAYTCYVLSRSGRKPQQRMEVLYEHRDKMNSEGRALLAAAYQQCGMPDEARLLLDVEPLADVDPTSITTRQTGSVLASPIRETALLLMTWCDVDPDAVVTANLAKRLMSLKRGDHWGTTQDNAFCLMALGKYAKLTADDASVKGTVKVGGRTYDFTTSEPLALSRRDLAGATAEISSESGIAYVSYTVAGVPLRPPDEALAQGLSLERRYLDREGNPVDLDALQQGQLVLVELSVGGNRTQLNVVLQDLLPAGLEIENPRLQSAEIIEGDTDNGGLVVDRMDVRDDRMLLFCAIRNVKNGIQRFRYTARAVTPGNYIVPPAMLDVMYDPQVQARTRPTRCTVLPR